MTSAARVFKLKDSIVKEKLLQYLGICLYSVHNNNCKMLKLCVVNKEQKQTKTTLVLARTLLGHNGRSALSHKGIIYGTKNDQLIVILFSSIRAVITHS